MIIVHWFHKQCNPAEILRFKSLSPCFIMLHMVAEGNTMDEKNWSKSEAISFGIHLCLDFFIGLLPFSTSWHLKHRNARELRHIDCRRVLASWVSIWLSKHAWIVPKHRDLKCLKPTQTISKHLNAGVKLYSLIFVVNKKKTDVEIAWNSLIRNDVTWCRLVWTSSHCLLQHMGFIYMFHQVPTSSYRCEASQIISEPNLSKAASGRHKNNSRHRQMHWIATHYSTPRWIELMHWRDKHLFCNVGANRPP